MNTTHDKFRLASPAHVTSQTLRAHRGRDGRGVPPSPPPSPPPAAPVHASPTRAGGRRVIPDVALAPRIDALDAALVELGASSTRARDDRRRRRRNGRRRRWRRGTRRRVNGAGSFLRFVRVDRDGTGANRRRAARRRRMRARRRTRARRRRSPSGRRRRRRLARAAVLITRGEGRDARVRG